MKARRRAEIVMRRIVSEGSGKLVQKIDYAVWMRRFKFREIDRTCGWRMASDSARLIYLNSS
jgi:hypothetical protein